MLDPECGSERSAHTAVSGVPNDGLEAPLHIEDAVHSPREIVYVPSKGTGSRWKVPLLAVAVLALVGACAGLRQVLAVRRPLQARPRPLRMEERGAAEPISTTADGSGCGLVEVDVEYHTDGSLYSLQNISSSALCCAECEGEPRCGAWVWGRRRGEPGVTDVCFLKELSSIEDLRTFKRRGIVSGLPSQKAVKHGVIAGQFSSRTKVLTAAIRSNMTCPGKVASLANMSVVSTQWIEPGKPARQVEVLRGNWVVPHLQSRAYLAESCTPGHYARSQYSELQVLGNTLRYTVHMSGAGCGCKAALKLVPMRQSSAPSKCSDYYCDSNRTCGASCAEISIQEANQYAWSSSLHLHDDRDGVSAGYVGGGLGKGRRDWTSKQYGPGASCIDTSRPFEVSISFPTDEQGSLVAMEVVLSQYGQACPLSAQLRHYAFQGRDGLAELTQLLRGGLTPVVSYTSSSDLLWLDGLGVDGEGPCARDSAAACTDSVRFYGFTVESIRRAPAPAVRDTSARPSALALRPVADAVHDLLGHTGTDLGNQPRPAKGKQQRHDSTTAAAAAHGTSKAGGAEVRSSSEWEVVFNGPVAVKSAKSASASLLGLRYKGMVLIGRREGDWLALDYEPGYVRIMLADAPYLEERTVSYTMILEGSCADHGSFPIIDAVTCKAAGIKLGYFDIDIQVAPEGLPRPEGCYVLEGELWLSASTSNRGRGKIGRRLPLCSSSSYAYATSTSTSTITVTSTPTSTTLTSTTTSTWVPTLYCFSVITMSTYEPSIVKSNIAHGAGIFACEAWALFTETGRVRLGELDDGTPVETTTILQLPPEMKNKGTLQDYTGATCFNTETFLRVWHTIVVKSLHQHQDWTVKVDPDAVFMPHRLAKKLIAHTSPGGSTQYLRNCNKFGLGPRMFGAIEVFSQKAIQSYKWGERNCVDFPWKGWGEDYFMEKCMDKLGVAPLDDFQMVADERCTAASCTDRSKVAFHAYKKLDLYNNCMRLATLADRNGP